MGAVIASMKSAFPLACGLLGKAATYGASATFHLVPFATVDGVTRAFIADLICVPVTLCGAIAPFVPSEAIGREAAVAACGTDGRVVLRAMAGDAVDARRSTFAANFPN